MRTSLAIAALAAMTTAADAHAMLEHATPGAGAVLASAPKMVALKYSEDIEPAVSSVSVTDPSGNDVTSGLLHVEDSQMSIGLKLLKPGTYDVRWTAISVDTHRTQGAFRFSVR